MTTISLFYSRNRLLVNNVISCGVFSAIGDVLEQYLTGDMQKKGWDWRATAILTAAGVGCGPALHAFYHCLDHYKWKGTHRTVVMKKVIFDTVTNPPFSAMFIFLASLLEGKTVRNSVKEYTDKWWEIMKVDMAIWPAANYVNFYLLPNKYRIVYVNVVHVIYSSFMAHIKKMKDEKLTENTQK